MFVLALSQPCYPPHYGCRVGEYDAKAHRIYPPIVNSRCLHPGNASANKKYKLCRVFIFRWTK